MARIFNDLGLGSKAQKLIRSDGSFNVRRTGISAFNTVNLYLNLIRMSWLWFLLISFALVAFLNLGFASIYYFLGVEKFNGMTTGTSADQFLDCLFFSFQTFTTVGYGHLSPRSTEVSLISAIEAITGLLVFAIITGLVYGRFAKPGARLLFSKRILIAPLNGQNTLQFRVVNLRKSVIMDLSCRMLVSFREGKGRVYKPLELERSSVVLFPLNWTIVHPITESSPIFGKSQEELERLDTEFIVALKGFDDTFSQEVNAIRSYHSSEVLWNVKFELMYEPAEDGATLLHLDKIDSVTDIL